MTTPIIEAIRSSDPSMRMKSDSVCLKIARAVLEAVRVLPASVLDQWQPQDRDLAVAEHASTIDALIAELEETSRG